LVQIVWRNAYDSGNVVIDDQHRALFNQVNLLFTAFLGQRPADEVSALLDRLVNDIVEHFRDEELLIAAAGYPDVAGHAAIHAGLIEHTVQLVDRFYAGDVVLGDVFRFLAHDVVVRHMLGEDRAFFPYLDSLHSDGYSHSAVNLPMAAAEPDQL
jgi:hemerythrin-like metal-binding protein